MAQPLMVGPRNAVSEWSATSVARPAWTSLSRAFAGIVPRLVESSRFQSLVTRMWLYLRVLIDWRSGVGMPRSTVF